MDFLTEKRGEGYQKEQVDAYIREMRQAYQQMYEAYQAAQRQAESLGQRCEELQRKFLEAEAQAQAMPAAMMNAQAQYGYQPYAAQQPMPYEAQQPQAALYGAQQGIPYGYYY